jgi:hypothetical protein
MSAFEAAIVMMVLFLFRLALPLMVILLFGYGTNRFLDYWNSNIEF